MSTTTDGYEERTKRKVDTIKVLKELDMWLDGREIYGHDEDTMEDARDLLDMIQRLCMDGRKKGKGRAV
jgi:hypothetical protein